MNADCMPKVVNTLRDIGAQLGLPVGFAVFDTFAKAIAAGGGDENQAKDQGRVFANLQRIKDATGCHIAIVGHTGKDETKGPRGSNAMVGDADLVVTLSGEAVKTATVTKANDAPEGPLFSFKSETHHFGTDEDGDPITVNVVSAEPIEAASNILRTRWPKGLLLVRDSVNAALAEHGAEHRVAGDGPPVRATEISHARDDHRRRYVSAGDGDRAEAERKAWKRNFTRARTEGLIFGEAASGRELIWISVDKVSHHKAGIG
jgi:hypothetical protein